MVQTIDNTQINGKRSKNTTISFHTISSLPILAKNLYKKLSVVQKRLKISKKRLFFGNSPKIARNSSKLALFHLVSVK